MPNNLQLETLLIPSPEAVTPDFVVPFDGQQPEVTPNEQAYVSQTFNSFFDDAFYSHMGSMQDLNANPEWPRNGLTLRARDPQNKGTWVAKLIEQPIENRDELEVPDYILPPKVLELTFTDENFEARTSFEYGLGADGVLRRHDAGDLLSTMPDGEQAWLHTEVTRDAVLGEMDLLTQTPKLPNDDPRTLAAAATEPSTYNFRDSQRILELNDQPVSAQELDGLMAMFSSSRVMVDSYAQ